MKRGKERLKVTDGIIVGLGMVMLGLIMAYFYLVLT